MERNDYLLREFIRVCKVKWGKRVVIDLEWLETSQRWLAFVTPPKGFWGGDAKEVFIVAPTAIREIEGEGKKSC
jgi:hypothetical protein